MLQLLLSRWLDTFSTSPFLVAQHSSAHCVWSPLSEHLQFPVEHGRLFRPRPEFWQGCEFIFPTSEQKLELLLMLQLCRGKLSHCCVVVLNAVVSLGAVQQWLLSMPLSNPLWTSEHWFARSNDFAGALFEVSRARSSSMCDVISAEQQQQHCARSSQGCVSWCCCATSLDDSSKLLLFSEFPVLLFSRK